MASLLKSSLLPLRQRFLVSKSCKLIAVYLSRNHSSGSYDSTSPLLEFNDYPGINNHDDLYRFSIENSSLFWSKLAISRLSWFNEYDQVQKCDFQTGEVKWFIGGKLNVSVNCVDRHVSTHPNKVALIWERDEPGQQEMITYRELHEMVNRMGNMLLQNGVTKGDRVAIYMPQCPMAVTAMLACARIGAVHCVVFAGFSDEALAGRIQDAQVNTVITADQGIRGGKTIELKRIVDSAVKKCPSVKQVFVYKRTGGNVPMGKIDIPLEKALSEVTNSYCKPEAMDSEDPLFMLYTSGSTGRPKGIVHTQAGYLLYTTVTHKHVFDYQPTDIFGCMADIGWITGHSYVVYGPLSNGGTTLLFESTPTYPDPGRYWEVVERLKLTHIYLSPTALRLLIKCGDKWVRNHDKSSLRILGSVGEPLNHEAWEWYNENIGERRCDIVDTWWQTETGGILISPRPSNTKAEILAAMPMRPFYGIEPCLLNKADKEMEGDNKEGKLCIKKPWPGMCRTIYGGKQLFLETYFKSGIGVYLSGDNSIRYQNGYYRITGRIDDVINVSGHRLGTAEIEDAIDCHVAVAESAVVGFPHDVKGEGIYAYVVLKDNVESVEEIETELKDLVKKQISGFAQPDIIQFVPGLPRTRSGKIMRRILRKIAHQEEDFGDTSTLVDPDIVETISKRNYNN
ncbi:acetyl-coenzyme A synthetase 2-like, mitochondrial isoform X1 [Argonauta hians]